MTKTRATPSSGGRHGSVERDRRKWEFWSRLAWVWELNARDTEPYRRQAVAALDLEPGDSVLDVGCGPGTNFDLLREAVGPAGRVVGLDFSPGMLAAAGERVREHGWGNVDLVLADATRPVIGPAAFDGALATTAVSATPDVEAVVEHVHAALRPGARFGVQELRLVQSGPARVLNPLVSWFYRAFGNWNAEEDVLDALAATFDDVTVLDTFALGTQYAAVASRRPLDES